jgi:hypothetical protein
MKQLLRRQQNLASALAFASELQYLCQQALAARGTTTADHVATTHSCHAGTKAMAALADKL